MKLQIAYNELQTLINKKTGKTVCFRKTEGENTIAVTYTIEVDVPLIGKISKDVDGKVMFNGITDTVLDVTYSLSMGLELVTKGIKAFLGEQIERTQLMKWGEKENQVLLFVDKIAEKLHVESIGDDGLVTCDPFSGGTWVELESSELYVHKPVLGADGVPIHEGDTVWLTDGRGPWKVSRIVCADRLRVICDDEENGHLNVYPDQLTHTKPEPPDSWERLEEDAGKNPFDYCKDVGHRLDTCENSEKYKARDLVRRARALAERGL